MFQSKVPLKTIISSCLNFNVRICLGKWVRANFNACFFWLLLKDFIIMFARAVVLFSVKGQCIVN